MLGRYLSGLGFFALLVLSSYYFPPAHSMGGPDAFGYVWTDNGDGVVYNWIEISGNGTDSGIDKDDHGVSVSIGFTFGFYGRSHPSVTISSNGYLTFGGIWTAYFNHPIPSTTQMKEIICPFWDDLTPVSSGSDRGTIYYKTQGTEPHRTFIVEWCDVAHFNDRSELRSHLTFEAILNEGSNQVKFQYKEMKNGKVGIAGGESATIGMQFDRSVGLQYSFMNASIHNGLAILFTPRLSSPSVEIDPQPIIHVLKDGEFTIEIWVRDIPEGYSIVGFYLWIEWDPNNVEYLSHAANDHGWPCDQWVDKTTGYAWFSCDPDIAHSVGYNDKWASITFRYLGESDSLITVPARFGTIWLWDGENEPVQVYPSPFTVLCDLR